MGGDVPIGMTRQAGWLVGKMKPRDPHLNARLQAVHVGADADPHARRNFSRHLVNLRPEWCPKAGPCEP